MRVKIVLQAIKHGVLPWWMYEKQKHYDCTYLQHLWINIRYAWRWATFNELQTDIDFENNGNNF